MQNTATERSACHYEDERKRALLYLELIADALRDCSKNTGTLRKDIWQYLLDYYRTSTDYGDFLRAIQKLLSEGKLVKNDQGIYRVEDNTYKELSQRRRKKQPSPTRLMKPNPLLSAKARAASATHPFAGATN